MKRHISMGSIYQLKQIVREINHEVSYMGLDEEKNPIYDNVNSQRTHIFTGTEKIHGTQNAVVYNNKDGFWTQSKKQITTPDNDNAGSSKFCTERQEILVSIIKDIAMLNSIDLDVNGIALYGEFCGGNVQKISAVTSLPKMLILFKYCKVFPVDEELADNSYFVSTNNYASDENLIYNISNFKQYETTIDIDDYKSVNNSLLELIENTIETNSPVGSKLGVDNNIGEGIVFQALVNGKLFSFKVKGDKHSKSKVKVLLPVDEEKERLKIELVNTLVPPRLEQAFQLVFDTLNGGEYNIKKTGDFIKWIIGDIAKEEIDLVEENGFTIKELHYLISKSCRKYLESC